MTLADLFAHAAAYEVTEDAVCRALTTHRADHPQAADDERDEGTIDSDRAAAGSKDESQTADDPANDSPKNGKSEHSGVDQHGRENTGRENTEATRPTRSPARVVADADVLAVDLLVGPPSREALDVLRAHSWTTLVASDTLVADATAVIRSLADDQLAADWREAIDRWREPVSQPAGDHPALASAYHGGAMQIISLDAALNSPSVAAGLRGRFPVSVREPQAFAAVFSPAGLYPAVVGGEYPGPDRDPRSMERTYETKTETEDQHT